MTDSREVEISKLAAVGLRNARFNHSIRMAAANGDYERLSDELDQRISKLVPEDHQGESGPGDGNAGSGPAVD